VRPHGPDSAPTGITRSEAHEFSARALAGRRFAAVTDRTRQAEGSSPGQGAEIGSPEHSLRWLGRSRRTPFSESEHVR